MSNSSLDSDITFQDYLVSEKRTCAGEDMIKNPTRSLTMTKCIEKCKQNDDCMFFFFTVQCQSGQVCSIPITPGNDKIKVCKSENKQRQTKGCCALFRKCDKVGHVNQHGHTCEKGIHLNIIFESYDE